MRRRLKQRIGRGVKKNDSRIYHVAKTRDEALEKVLKCEGKQDSLDFLLRKATYWDDVITAKVAFEHGADPNSQNFLGESALENVCKRGGVDMLRLFISKGASLGLDKFGGTPLVYAIQEYRENIVKELINAGADVNQRENSLLMTPLDVAVVRPKCLGIVKMLLNAGADPRMARGEDNDVLDYVIDYNERFGDVSPKVFPLLKVWLKKWKGKPLPPKARRKPKSAKQKASEQFFRS